MKAGCAAQKLQFEAHGKRDVVADFDGGRMTSDGGGLLLREANCCLGDLMARLGQCVSDFRQQGSVEHTATDLIAQRVCALALGYEDLNDHGTLRRDSLLALLAGRKDLTGQGRKRKRDRAAPLTSAATLKRFELGRPETAAQHRYHRMLVDRDGLDNLLVGPVPGVAGGSAGGDLAGPGRDRRPDARPAGRPFLSWLLPGALLSAAVHFLRAPRAVRAAADGGPGRLRRQRGGAGAHRGTDPGALAGDPDPHPRGRGVLPRRDPELVRSQCGGLRARAGSQPGADSALTPRHAPVRGGAAGRPARRCAASASSAIARTARGAASGA